MSRKSCLARASEIVTEIYTELYANAEPSFDYAELINSPEEVRKSFDYNKHYLPREDYERIVNKHLNKCRLSSVYKSAISVEAWLGHGPTSFKSK